MNIKSIILLILIFTAINITLFSIIPSIYTVKAQSSSSTSINAIYPGYSSSYNCKSTNFIVTEYCAYTPTLLFAILLNFLIAALFFLIGSMLKNDRWRSIGMGEFYEAVAGTIIIGLFLYIAWVILIVIPTSLAPTATQGSLSPITFTLKSISSIENNLESAFNSVYPNYFNWMSASSSETDISAGGTKFPIKFSLLTAPFLFTTILPDYGIAQFLVDGMYILWAEYFLIEYATLAAIPAFIIPGIIFRAFFPTRGFGSMLIAIGTGFLIVMPTLFAFSFSSVCSSNGGVATLSSCNLGTPLPSQAKGIFNNAVEDYMAPFWMVVLFFPALIIALTYAFITTTANFLGQSASMGGRIRGFI
ncbi:MAG: hypothetical protein ACP5LH_01795 [Candidatus Micrarchaeia archaeon]